MRYGYLDDFRRGISVFAIFSYGIAVLGTPHCPPPSAEVETNKRLVESLKSRSEEIFSVQKELGGLHCRWKAYHQDLDRIDEMKHLGPVYKERGLPLC